MREGNSVIDITDQQVPSDTADVLRDRERIFGIDVID